MRLRQFDTSTIKILITSRPDIETQLFSVQRPQYKISVTKRKVEPDMEAYIDVTLSRYLEEGKLKLRDGRLIATISQALRDGSGEMILWTRLFIEELCAQGSDKIILKALTRLPRGLAELYDQKLRRVQSKQNAEQADDILRFCAFLKRPLTLPEYEDLLGIKPEQESHDPANCPTDMMQVISDCCGLISVDEEDNTVHYVHHSVGEHLSANSDRCEKVDQHLGVLCLTYLDFTDFKRQLAKLREGFNTPIQPLQLGVLPLPSVGRRVALEILSRGRHLRHLRELDTQIDGKIWRLFCQCVEGSDIPVKRPWNVDSDTGGKSTDRRKEWLLANRHPALLWYYALYHPITGNENLDTNILEEFARRLEHGCGFKEAVSLFWTKLNWNSKTPALCYALVGAAETGCKVCVEHLIQLGDRLDTRVPSTRGHNSLNGAALIVAAEKGHLQVVKILLQAKADLNARSEDLFGLTALQAAFKGHIDVVNTLIQAKADVNAEPGEILGRTALQAAAEWGHIDVVNTLIQAKADVNAESGEILGRTALQAAAEWGHIDVVNTLIQAKADVNAESGEILGRTALQAAAEWGHIDVVNTLIQANADVNAPPGPQGGRTALQCAQNNGWREVAERLRQAGAIRPQL
ncbi:hypothetical protein N7520_008258 [Penicillium odoratum]|uniref:uncharacterized protein n=1 Tax=Penicillium odoratum TaxID=1167516 RepID=UPI002548421D|nr:uncharacterized protein N7520_008258 [Penicillium odoratum]KAJ5761102.1 hypothetical protein N7520_008258 [Penicillium odoratum]